MNTSLKNSSMFIIPNSLHSWRSELWCEPLSKMEDRPSKSLSYKMRAEELRPFGIETKLDDIFVQVWIHCEGSDNLTDHGFDDDQIKELFPSNGQRIVNDCVFAPGFIPIRLLTGKKEGDTITLTTVDGVDWEIKLEQLDYRYGHFGRFEEVLDNLIFKDKQNSVALELMAKWLTDKGIQSEYKFGKISAFLAGFKDMGLDARFDEDKEYIDVTYLNRTVRVLRLDRENSRIVPLQYNIAKLKYAAFGVLIAEAFSRAA